ncbi:protein turtle-like isoform X2 [Panulirus ornatus]|uniref:protein turtle-like isoform X2 n=1 Tax=Panulirus ornatus TaxID=150431 RepID=UPI003A8ABCBE
MRRLVWITFLWILNSPVIQARHGEESEFVHQKPLLAHLVGSTSPLVNVTAVMEGEALLPCDMSTTLEDDLPVLIMFYSNDSGTPIYTVDLRGRRISQAKHQPLSVLKNRSKFDLRSGKSGLYLKTVWSSDDGLYRCRVDFKKSPTRNSRIYLTVIVPPDSVRIVDINGNEKSSTIGPYVLGMTLTLKCIATGGRPPPKLTWWAVHKEVRGEVTQGTNEVISTLTVPSLQRHHLHQSFICQASNAELAVPVTAAVTIDMTLPPMSINLMGVDGPISAGVGVTMVCVVVGARPPPTVSWWLDGRPLKSTGERLRDNNNVTESQVVVVATPEDQGRYLSCRAETPGLLQSSLEDGTKLVVHYVPEVYITLDPRLELHDIREGMDVFFTCSVTAVPDPTAVHWYHNENHLRANSTGGVIVANMSLVLQKVDRYSSGGYTCRATNNEGQGVSRPIVLDVKYSPVCRPEQRWVYGIARHEMVHVSCEVDAHPKHVTFAWVFNNSVEATDIPEAHITNNLTLSTLTYTPITQMDYGFLLCWATNSVGKQREPCVFKIFPAGPPDALKNCTVLNESTDAVQVRCDEGFDGGLRQSFVMEVYETEGRKLKSNVTSKTPFFTVRGLPSGLALTIRIYAANAKGRSDPSVLPAATIADVPEKHISGVIQASELPSTMELYPSLAIIMGVVGGILVVFVVIVVVMVVRRPRRENLQGQLHQDDSSLHILKKDDSHSGRLDVDEKDPDVIPETRVLTRRGEPPVTCEELNGCELSELAATQTPPTTHDSLCPLHLGSRADLMDRRGVADVSTIYGEMVANSPEASHTHAPTDPPPHTHSNAYAESSHVTQATHAHVEPVHAHIESQPHAHQSQYIQQEYASSPLPVDMHHSVSYHHMPPTPTTVPAPMYTHAHAMPVSHTQTLPHPRSSHTRGHSAHAGTLQRRSSLYMDPMTTPLVPPIAPPPAYDTPTSSLAPDMVAVVPIVAETVCITPNASLHAHISPPEQYPPKPFPTSFSSDRMESAV